MVSFKEITDLAVLSYGMNFINDAEFLLLYNSVVIIMSGLNQYKCHTTLIHLNERSLALIIKILFSKRNKLLGTSLADKPKDKNIFVIGTREIKS